MLKEILFLNIEAGEFLEELDQLEHFHMLRQ